jgi:[ribosomal protein S18]-alanine N-acetyltransferase
MIAIERASATAGHFSEAQYREAIEQSARAETRGQWRLALVVEENSRLSGFLIGRILDDEWEIENIAVAVGSHKKGLATALVNEFLSRASKNGATKIFLEVRESNAAARRCYEKCGFAQTDRRKNYYRDPVEDALLYTHQAR